MTLRILIVDDDPDILRTLTRGLERRSYQVVCAAKADSAYAILENQHIDIVVLDLLMPQCHEATCRSGSLKYRALTICSASSGVSDKRISPAVKPNTSRR